MKGRDIFLVALFFLLGLATGLAFSYFLVLPAKEKVFKEKTETLNQRISQLKKNLENADKELEVLRNEINRLFTETAATQKAEEDTARKIPSPRTNKHIGLIKKAYTSGGKRYITIDYIQWFTGAAAVEAAREDGYITPDETSVPNDIYTRNISAKLRTFKVSPSAVIRLLRLGNGAETYSSNWSQLVSRATFSRPPLCWVYLNTKNIVTKVEEQYAP